jgi:hypothetical protein
MMASTLATVREIRRTQRADGPAAVLGIGTANPTNYVFQEEFPDYYFRVTKKDHLTDLKDTFKIHKRSRNYVCKHVNTDCYYCLLFQIAGHFTSTIS